MKRHALLLLALLVLGIASSVPAQAQTPVVNPRIVEFDPSADHSTMGAGGQPLVQRYELRIFTLGTTQPYTTTDLGKPAPETDGKIRVDFTTRISPWPPDGNYEARVAAVGPSGLGLSDPSNPFSLVSSPVPSCTYTLSSQSLSLAASAGTSPLTITTQSTCAWTATSNATWVSPAPPSGTGTAALSITVAGNTAPTARTATLTIGGQAVTVTQAGVPACAYSAAPTSVPIGAAGGSSNVTVTAGSGCSWTASSSASWASVTASGSGSGPATITVAGNTATTARTATLTIAGRAVTVTQAGAACTFSLSATGGSVPADGGGGTVSVTAGAGCGWTASSGASWVTVSPSAGTGAGTVAFNADPNTGGARSATLTVAGRSYVVTQAGLPCSTSVNPTVIPASGYSQTISITVTSAAGCGWTASTPNSSWITLQATSGTADGTVSAVLNRNSTKAVRTGTIVVGGRTCTITQAAPPAPSQPKKPRVR